MEYDTQPTFGGRISRLDDGFGLINYPPCSKNNSSIPTGSAKEMNSIGIFKKDQRPQFAAFPQKSILHHKSNWTIRVYFKSVNRG